MDKEVNMLERRLMRIKRLVRLRRLTWVVTV